MSGTDPTDTTSQNIIRKRQIADELKKQQYPDSSFGSGPKSAGKRSTPQSKRSIAKSLGGRRNVSREARQL